MNPVTIPFDSVTARALCVDDAPRDLSPEVAFSLGMFNFRIAFDKEGEKC